MKGCIVCLEKWSVYEMHVSDFVCEYKYRFVNPCACICVLNVVEDKTL